MSSSAANIVDDDDPRLVYTPASNWIFTTHDNGYNVVNGTIHLAFLSLSSVSLNFTSDYIGANFLLLQTGGNFSVYLDGQISGPYSTTVALPSQVGPDLVFEQTGLDPNVEHNIQVQMISPPDGWKSPIANVPTPSINFDSFSLVKGATLAASGTSTENSSNSNTSGSRTSTNVAGSPSTILSPIGAAPTSASRISIPVVVGAALGGLSGLLLLLAFVVICLRRRKRYYEEAGAEKDGSLHSTATGRGRPSNSGNRYFSVKFTSDSSKPQQVVSFPNEMGSRTRLDADIDNGLRYEDTRPNHHVGKRKRDTTLRNDDDNHDAASHDGENSIYTGVADEHSIVVNQVDSNGLSPISLNVKSRNGSAVAPHTSEKQGQNHQNQYRPSPSMDSTPTRPDGLPPFHPSNSAPMVSSTSLIVNDAMFRELIDLRAEVRRLTHIQARRSEGSSVITSATLAMPPPLYGQ